MKTVKNSSTIYKRGMASIRCKIELGGNPFGAALENGKDIGGARRQCNSRPGHVVFVSDPARATMGGTEAKKAGRGG